MAISKEKNAAPGLHQPSLIHRLATNICYYPVDPYASTAKTSMTDSSAAAPFLM